MGVLLALVAASCWGAAGILTRMGLRHASVAYGTVFSLAVSFGVSAIVVLAAARDALPDVSLSMVLWFSVIGVLNFTLGRFFNYMAMSRIGVTRSSPLIASSPFFAVVMAMLFLREVPSALVGVGTVAIFAGMLLILTGRR